MLDDKPKVRIGALLEQASAHWRQQLQAALAAQGAPALGAAAELLGHIPADGIPQSGLAERIGLSKQAVQQFLDQLESHGLVHREPDASDRRAKRVRITEAGLVALELRRDTERQLERQFRARLGGKFSAKLKKSLKIFTRPE